MNLHSKTIGGMKWTTLSTLIATLLQLSTIVVLTRFLAPDDFGLMAIMMVVIGFSQVFMDMGISNAIIHRQDVTHSQLSSLYWLNLFSGMVITITLILLAPLLSIFYAEPDMTHLLWILSSVFIIVALGNQYRVLAQKEMEFRRMALIEISTALMSFIVAATLAVKGYGINALVFAMLTQASVSSLSYLYTGLRKHHKPSLHYKHTELKGYFNFGLYQMGDRSFNYLNANIDNILIGKFLGMEALGFYNLAWQLCIFPVQKINPIVNKVAFPIYAKVQKDNAQLSEYYNKFLQTVAFIVTPLLAFLFYFPDPIVMTIYGEGWEQTAAIVSIFACVGLIKVLGNPAGSVFLALGRADIGFWWNVVWLLGIGSLLMTILQYTASLSIVVWSILIITLLYACIWHFIVIRIANISYKALWIPVSRIILACFLIGKIAHSLVQYLPWTHPILILGSAGIICLLLYALFSFIFEKTLINWLRTKET